MNALLATLVGGALAIAGGLLGAFATDRGERSRWRRDAQLRVSTACSLQEVISWLIDLAYLAEKPPRGRLVPAASGFHEATIGVARSAILLDMVMTSIVLFGLAALLDLSGVALLVSDAKRAGAELQRWVDLNPNGNREGSWNQVLTLNQTVRVLLRNQTIRWWAIVLLIAGIVIGFVGNW